MSGRTGGGWALHCFRGGKWPAEGKQSIARAASRMNAAECGSDSGMFLDESDAFVEIARAKKNVIEHGGHVNGSPGNNRRGECASGHSEK